MELTNEFQVPVDADTAFATLTDLAKVAPCLPGASLESVDGDVYTGQVKVKVGPVQVTYRGMARMVEVDAEQRQGRIEASGKETRGSGTARADVVARVEPHDEGAVVTVTTDLNITGKPAQFGRGVMEEVGTNVLDAFAERLQEMLERGEGAPTAVSTSATAAPPADAEPTVEHRAGPETLDLMAMAGSATAKRLLPLVGALALVLFVLALRRRQRAR